MTSLAVCEALTGLASTDLTDLQEMADLQTRMDRKYILDPATVVHLLRDQAAGLLVLEIGSKRDFAYESVYFDTPTLDSYRGSAHGRRRRFKVRTRSYLDSDLCVLEVKTSGGRGETVKERMDYSIRSRDRLLDSASAFLAQRGIPTAQLRPTLTTSYQRSTVLGLDGVRATLDQGLRCLAPDGRQVDLPHHVLLETKSPGQATNLDRFLWAAGHRPVRVSKYCTGLAALCPELPANKWNRTLRRHFDWAPAIT